MKNCILLLAMVFLISIIGNSASIVLVNGKEYSGECVEIRKYEELVDLSSVETDQVDVRNIRIEDDCLIIEVVYGGGCGTVNFELISNGQILESNPSQIQLFLKLDDQDTCKAMLSREIRFNISQFNNLKTEKGVVFKIMGTDISVVWE